MPVRGVVAGAALLAFLALAALAVYWPRSNSVAPTKPPDARYLRIRATCEDRATRQLDPIYQVGGRHWVDAVNRCMLDLASD